jgi:hypothetical protein
MLISFRLCGAIVDLGAAGQRIQVDAQRRVGDEVDRRDNRLDALWLLVQLVQAIVDVGKGRQHAQFGHALRLGAVEQVLVEEVQL